MKLSISRRRKIARVLHLVVAIPIGSLVYAPEVVVLTIRPVVQLALFPVLALTGLWMWQGHRLGVGPYKLVAQKLNGWRAS